MVTYIVFLVIGAFIGACIVGLGMEKEKENLMRENQRLRVLLDEKEKILRSISLHSTDFTTGRGLTDSEVVPHIREYMRRIKCCLKEAGY